MRIAKLEFGLVDSKDHHHEKLHGGLEGGKKWFPPSIPTPAHGDALESDAAPRSGR